MTTLFSLTLFLSAALLFLIQPLIAKALLPLLGGAPAVWTTCMLFFQTALLAGYAHAWLTPRWLGMRILAVVHLSLLLIAAALFPIYLPSQAPPTEQEMPVPWLLGLLGASIGLPFFLLAASAPLLQLWFSNTRNQNSGDPYFLYAASNLGSMTALLAYPVLVEPWLTLDEQRSYWMAGYAVLIVLTTGCVAAMWRKGVTAQKANQAAAGPEMVVLPEKKEGSPVWWILLALVPSSLMLSVTLYLTTDVAAEPLFWVAPLAIYLLTFVLSFARRQILPRRLMVRTLPIMVVVVTLAMLLEATEPLLLLAAGHLLMLFVVGMVCHGELAQRRPEIARLGSFYFCLALGGALGGVFNALIAPLIFPGLWEYPLLLVLASLIVPLARQAGSMQFAWPDILIPGCLGILTASTLFAVPRFAGIVLGIAAVLCYMLSTRPLRFGLGVAALLLAGSLQESAYGRTIYRERDFFGVHRVTLNTDHTAHLLVHGNTVHGMQWLDPARKHEALTYYHARGPIGLIFAHRQERRDSRPVAVVGLGAGTLASYGQKGQDFAFYEIDPAVIRIAKDQRFFTFLHDSPAQVSIVRGDARLTLTNALSQHYSLIVIDAFCSDAIPVHLLTREALAIYRSKLANGGILAFHVSNRYLDLTPVLGDMAADARMVCLMRHDTDASLDQEKLGHYPSQWAFLAERREDLPASALWLPVEARPGVPVWTDGYCNLAGALKLRR